jgi:LysM repeat protein
MKRLISIFILVSMSVMADFSIVQGGTLPDSAYIPGVIGHAQSYSISCEARSAADLAAFWGFNVGETEFLQALPSSDNPDQGFVGDPNEVWGRLPPHGYGVHAGPVAEALRALGLQAEAHHDLTWDDLRGEISAGRPVIVWVIGAMWPGAAVDYKASDGSLARVATFEHTMLLTGYSAESVEVIDAYNGQYQYYWLNSFINSWSVLGNMAVFVDGKSLQQQPEIEASGATYTVKPGDYLMALARDYGISWVELAELNTINYPYIIYAGQVLQLPKGASQETAPELASVAAAEGSSQPINYSAHLPIVLSDYIASPAVTDLNPEPGKTVIVLHSDTLIGFARGIGVAWHVLVKLNNLPSNYIVHPGEILKVK